MRNYYKILKIDTEADDYMINEARKALAKKYHSDVNKSPDAEEIMKDINEAYDVLINPEKRKKFDETFFGQEDEFEYDSDNVDEKYEEEFYREFERISKLAKNILQTIEQEVKEKKWRSAQEKLFAFEGLGKYSDNVRPTFPMLLPEWQQAKLLEQKAAEIKRLLFFWITIEAGVVNTIIGSVIGFIYSIIIIFESSTNISMENMFFSTVFFTIVGAVVGAPIGIIGSLIYQWNWGGKNGAVLDRFLGYLTGLTFLFFAALIIGYFVLMMFLHGLLSSSNNKKK